MKNLFTRSQPTITAAPVDLYDLSLLEEMDDNEYVLEVLTILLIETPKDLKQMKDALQAREAGQVCQAAHKLKSSAGIIQADKFTNLLADIEDMGKKGVISSELAGLVESAGNQYQHIERSLKTHVASLK
ncbi:MAG: Hpt domain-containing protein [Ferruginibacter sp.]